MKSSEETKNIWKILRPIFLGNNNIKSNKEGGDESLFVYDRYYFSLLIRITTPVNVRLIYVTFRRGKIRKFEESWTLTPKFSLGRYRS